MALASEIVFDFHDHAVVATSGDGRRASFALATSTVAEFHANFARLISDLGGTPDFPAQPNEVPDPVPFDEDHRDRRDDRDAVRRLHQALMAADAVFKSFGTSFLGKSSPVHLFWGSFDLAVTRLRDGRRRYLPAAFQPYQTMWRRKPCRRAYARAPP
ncbi:DUF5996 family protein [Neorhizobium galegae]|uniref:DUF5996 family protein n=1 Tax=Neorhizobium galegae TaxID=399 RepID=UPI00351EF55A